MPPLPLRATAYRLRVSSSPMAAGALEAVETPEGVLEWHAPGYLLIRLNEGGSIDRTEAQGLMAVAERWISGAGMSRAPLLIDRSNRYSPTFQAHFAFRDWISAHLTAIVYYCPHWQSLFASEIVRDTMILDRVPTEIYRTRQEATYRVETLATLASTREA